MARALRRFVPMFFVVLLICCHGCVSVKQTAGIKACAREQAEAEILALRMKQRYSDSSDTAYTEAASAFDDAAASVSLFYKGIIDEVDLDQVVDVAEERFLSSDAAAQLADFQSKAIPLMGSGVVIDPATATSVADFVADIVQRILDAHNKAKADALNRVRSTLLQKAEPLFFEEVTREAIRRRYSTPVDRTESPASRDSG